MLNKIIKYIKLFWHWKLAKSISLPYLPESISIEVTNVCNFKCAFCPQSDPEHFNKIPKSTLTVEKLKLYLEKLKKAGVETNLLHWTLDGEPFINKDFEELSRVAEQYGFNNQLFATNGYFLSEERIKGLSTSVKYTFTTDFCSDKSFFETYRGTPNSWERIKINILHIINNKKFNNINFLITDISSYSKFSKDELITRFEKLKSIFPKSNRIKFKTRVFHNATGFVKTISKKSNKYNLCPYPWLEVVIASNGDVVTCCRDLEHKYVLGNLNTQEFDEIWNGEKYVELRKALIEEKPEKISSCANCDMPYDDSKFSIKNISSALLFKLQLFETK
jgi:radical SAM protein with 4Fe4S-binding SPASM domain